MVSAIVTFACAADEGEEADSTETTTALATSEESGSESGSTESTGGVPDDCEDDFDAAAEPSQACVEALQSVCGAASNEAECPGVLVPRPPNRDWQCAWAKAMELETDAPECSPEPVVEGCFAFEYVGDGGMGTDPCPDFVALTTLYYRETSSARTSIVRPPSGTPQSPLYPLGYHWCSPINAETPPGPPACECAEEPICAG
jgi:hypothetical protein